MKLNSTSNLNTEQRKFSNNVKSRQKCNLNYRRKHLSYRALPVLFYITFHASQVLAQNASADSVFSEPLVSSKTRTLFGGTVTNLGYGGPSIKFSRFSNQYAIMPGGRGACIINNRITLGGGGYGMTRSIQLLDSGADTDTLRYYKMGYGGLELGYLLFPGRKLNFGGTLLVAAGAEFLESKPKSNSQISYGNDFKIITVMEPSIYVELQLNQFIRLHTGISYRFINSSNLVKIYVPDMNSFSINMGLLLGKS